MVIRKRFSFEGSHIVRNCSSVKCKYSIHGHSYVLELFLSADRLDNGQMIYDFGLLKSFVKEYISAFDHAMVFWEKDDQDFIEFVKKNSTRWVSLPVSSSAEILALMFLKAITFILSKTDFNNNEGNIKVSSVRVHETATGYAEAFDYDLENKNFPEIDLNKIIFSNEIQDSWSQENLWSDLLSNKLRLVNPSVKQQI